MNIHDIQNIKREIKDRRKKPLRHLLESIDARILTAAEMDFDEVSYLIPPFVLGEAPYTMKDAITYLKTKLSRRGFKVTATDNRILINWSKLPPQKPPQADHTQHSSGGGGGTRRVSFAPKPVRKETKVDRDIYAALHEFANPAKL